jgi:NADPH:quinone reductase-like Zn-dependent oxidoreductase
MRAIRIHGFGGIDTMRLDEIPRPVPGAGEVLVAVKAAGVGPWDRLVREGRSGLGQKLPLTLGSEFSGTVAALGAGGSVFALGDAVYGATNERFVGGYAEYALVEAGRVAPKPATLDYVTAAGLPVVAVIAWQMLFEHARIEPGQGILVRGAAGSVGVCVTQMAMEAGASVYGTARARDLERVRALGAEPVVEGDRVGAQLASRSLDAVIDTVGGDALESTCEALRPNGIIVSVVRAPDEAYLRPKGVRAAYFIVDVTRDRLDRISAMVERGTLNLPVGEVLVSGGDHRAREQCPQGILVSRGRPRGDRYGNAGDPLFSRAEPDTQLHQGGRRMPCQSAGPDARYPKNGG